MLSRVLKTQAPQVAALKATFRTSARNTTSVVDADSSKSMNKVYHSTAIALAALTPLAFALSPSPLNLPVDIILGVLFPIHSHVALNYVISDYVPKSARGAARFAVLGATIVALAGLFKLNLDGPGLTETVKSFWRKPEEKK